MKNDPRLADAVGRLRNSPDFRLYTEHLQALLEESKTLLVNTPVADTPVIQGRARILQDLVTLTRGTP